MNKTIVIIQARLGSTRLPGKVLLDLGGRPLIQWSVDSARLISGVDGVVIATTDQASDDPIVEWANAYGVPCHRGPEDDVLKRYALAAVAEQAHTIIRITSDCPFIDPHVCGQVLALHRRTHADYVTNNDPPSWLDGLDCEIMTREALEMADRTATRPSDREHVTTYIRNNRSLFEVQSLVCPLPSLSHERWTVDTPEDMAFLTAVVERLAPNKPASFLDVLTILDAEPQLHDINASSIRDTGLAKSVANEPLDDSRSFKTSNEMLIRAEAVIPLGSQTFSKSKIQYPVGNSPLFLTHGLGARVWDVDGNEYVDLVSGLLPIVLGYKDPDVDDAIRRQMTNGISFSMATDLETKLAEKLVDIIPCAESVRFGKNGTDATSGAIRIARAATGRDRIAVCGYHGWQDWYIGVTSRNKGIPSAVSNLTHSFPYNDVDALDALLCQHKGEFAAVIMEPAGGGLPNDGYLQSVKEVVHKHGSILIFDEVITGFRWAAGGAQEYYGVTPDLAAFGKALGNGMPISAIVGRADLMREMEEIFFSGTFGGETLSLAASIAVVDKISREPVIDHLWKTGDCIAAHVDSAIARHNLTDVISLNGAAPWKILAYKDHPKASKEAIKTLFIQEMLRAGILVNSSHNVSYAIGEADLSKVFRAYDIALETISCALDSGDLERIVGDKIIHPVFKLRSS